MSIHMIKPLILAVAIVTSAGLGAQPNSAHSTVRPETLYHNYCSVCHGDRGNGQSRARNSLVPPPRDFTAANLQLTRAYMIAVTRDGKPGTAMVGWKTQLSDHDITGVVDYIRRTFMQAEASRGRNLYQKNCAVCHGDRGQGAVWAGGNMARAPRDFSTAAARKDLTRASMIAVATHGKAGTAMAGFATRLDVKDIETVVDYIRAAFMQVDTGRISGTYAHGGREKDAAPAAASPGKVDMALSFPAGLRGNRSRGEKFYLANCATCHGVRGDGQGPRAYFIRPRPRNFTDGNSRQMLNRPALFAATAKGKLGSEMPAWETVLSAQEIADVAEYVFTAYIQPAATLAGGKGER